MECTQNPSLYFLSWTASTVYWAPRPFSVIRRYRRAPRPWQAFRVPLRSPRPLPAPRLL